MVNARALATPTRERLLTNGQAMPEMAVSRERLYTHRRSGRFGHAAQAVSMDKLAPGVSSPGAYGDQY